MSTAYPKQASHLASAVLRRCQRRGQVLVLPQEAVQRRAVGQALQLAANAGFQVVLPGAEEGQREAALAQVRRVQQGRGVGADGGGGGRPACG